MSKLKLTELPHIFVTSDWHLGHDREFIWKARGFENLEQMENAIVERHNSLVRPQDDVYILGDLMLGSDLERTLKIMLHMNGIFHIVRGNHDSDKRWAAYKNLVFTAETENAIYLKYLKYHFYMSHYPSLTGNLEKESLKQMTLCLFGHTHQKEHFFEDRPYMYNVGVDAHNCYPCNLTDIIQEMKEKVKECERAAGDGITPHDACVSPDIPPAFEAWTRLKHFEQTTCSKCVYEGLCKGPSFMTGTCPEGYKYRRDPPDGGYYG